MYSNSSTVYFLYWLSLNSQTDIFLSYRYEVFIFSYRFCIEFVEINVRNIAHMIWTKYAQEMGS